MKTFISTIKELILLFLLLGFGSALIDYARISAGEIPVFCNKDFDATSKVESFKGLFYTASRKVHVKPEEKLLESSDISFHLLSLPLSTPSFFKTQSLSYTLDPVFSDACSSSYLYFADLNTKIYLYCIDSIDYHNEDEIKPFSTSLKEIPSLAEDMVSKLSFHGLAGDESTRIFTANSNVTSKNLTVYRCHKRNVNDIYIAPIGTPMQEDFCIYKDDDDDFLWNVVEDNGFYDESEREIISEDETYYYEYPKERLTASYVYYPAVRGKRDRSVSIREILDQGIYSVDELRNRGLSVELRPKNPDVVEEIENVGEE